MSGPEATASGGGNASGRGHAPDRSAGDEVRPRRMGARVLAAGIALAGVLGTAALSQVPYRHDDMASAVLRLSWRAVSERVEECREATQDELARLPAHMRQPRICEGRVAPFRLRLELDGDVVINEEVRATGAREDRPIYVLREIALPAGSYDVRVRFDRAMAVADTTTGPVAAVAGAAGAAPAGRRFPADLEWAGRVSVAAGDVALITYDGTVRSLTLRQPTRLR